jgi:signal transduction histidine kinase
VSPGSLRVRLLLAAAISIFVALALAAAGLAWLFERHVEHWLDAELEVQLNQLLGGIERTPAGQIEIVTPPADPRFNEPTSGFYWQVAIEPDGPVLRSRSLWDYQLMLPTLPVGDELHRSRMQGPAGATLYVLQRRVKLPANLGGSIAQAAIGFDIVELRAAVWRFARALLPFLLLVGLLLTAAAWVQVSIGLRPLTRLRSALGAIRSGELTRLGGGFPDEVQPLARGIDSLLAAREVELEKARTRASDLAHGLKTPLQVLAGEAGRLKASGAGDAANSIEELAVGMQRHIDRHLARARLATGGEHISTRVSEVAERVINVVSRTPAGIRLSWSNLVPADICARIDADDLAEALGNLIENGAQYARSKLIVSASEEGERVALSVSDDGPGIPKARRNEALERGKSLDDSGRGSGIGLAIVADIIEAWDGTLAFEDCDHGLTATLSIPRAQAKTPTAPRARRKAL